MAQIYPFISGSVSKPESSWIGFETLDEASRHAGRMNQLRNTYDTDKRWNFEAWPTKPGAWIAKPNPKFAEPVKSKFVAVAG